MFKMGTVLRGPNQGVGRAMFLSSATGETLFLALSAFKWLPFLSLQSPFLHLQISKSMSSPSKRERERKKRAHAHGRGSL